MHQFAVCAGVHLCGQLCDRGMETMVEPDFDSAIGRIRRAQQPLDLICPDSGRLFHEDMGPSRQRSGGQLGQVLVDDRHNQHIRFEPEQFVERPTRSCAVVLSKDDHSIPIRVEGTD
jgi:hypothetical protein